MNKIGTYVGEGFYTLPEAAGLLALDVAGVTSASLRRFFSPTKKYDEAIRSNRVVNNKIRDVSFYDLIEMRWVAHFKNAGVSAQAIRLVASSARTLFGEHPFARRDVRFNTDRKTVYANAASEVGDQRLMELVERQFEFEFIQETFVESVEWDSNDMASLWRPRVSEFPNVVVDPKKSFGAPSLEMSGVTTRRILDAWRAEDGNTELVADWFEVTETEVTEAIRFELELPARIKN